LESRDVLSIVILSRIDNNNTDPLTMRRYLIILAVVISVSGLSFVTMNDRLFEISKNIELFINTFKELNANYVDEIDPGKLMRTGIDAMVGSLDPYTNYISESQVESYRLNDDVRYGGTNIDIEIKTFDGQSRSLTVPRATTTRKNVPYYGFVDDGIGYVSLTTFTADASKNIAKGIKALKKENPSLNGIILDLRYNGGGLLREAINVSNLFINKGELIVSTRGKLESENKEFESRNSAMDLDTPLAVLINKKSASASEIVSGVIQDLDRGVVVGQRSFGKGLVQNTKEIGYNSRVKLTTSKYYIPSGRCIQSVEYENGEPKDIEDSARSVFKTKGGRTVLDGGGVTPDVKLPAPIKPDIVQKLKENDIIFKFVNTIVAKTQDTLQLDQIDYNQIDVFKRFVDQEKFKYVSQMKSELDIYESKVALDPLYAAMESEVDILRDKIETTEASAIDDHEDAILIEINKELSSRYHYEKGKIYSTLDQDEEIKECIKILNDQSRYSKILSK